MAWCLSICQTPKLHTVLIKDAIVKVGQLTRLVLPNRTPISAWEQPFVVPGLVIHIMGKDGNHIFVRVGVHMMHAVALVEHVGYHFRLGHVSDC